MALIVDHKIYTLTAAERWYVLHADWRFANDYDDNDDYDDDDSYTDEELAAEYGAEMPYPDYDLDDIELPGFGATDQDVKDILDDMPPLDEPDEGSEIW